MGSEMAAEQKYDTELGTLQADQPFADEANKAVAEQKQDAVLGTPSPDVMETLQLLPSMIDGFFTLKTMWELKKPVATKVTKVADDEATKSELKKCEATKCEQKKPAATKVVGPNKRRGKDKGKDKGKGEGS